MNVNLFLIEFSSSSFTPPLGELSISAVTWPLYVRRNRDNFCAVVNVEYSNTT